MPDKRDTWKVTLTFECDVIAPTAADAIQAAKTLLGVAPEERRPGAVMSDARASRAEARQ